MYPLKKYMRLCRILIIQRAIGPVDYLLAPEEIDEKIMPLAEEGKL
jgi:hypothetical protein